MSSTTIWRDPGRSTFERQKPAVQNMRSRHEAGPCLARKAAESREPREGTEHERQASVRPQMSRSLVAAASLVQVGNAIGA